MSAALVCFFTLFAFVTFLPGSPSVGSMWQRRVRPCCSHTACTHKPGVSSSRSSPCSSQAPPCSSPWVAAGTPHSWPPGCATASACSSSCPPSQRKCTSTPRSGRRGRRGSGRGPSVSMKVGSNVDAAPLCIPEAQEDWIQHSRIWAPGHPVIFIFIPLIFPLWTVS